MIDWIVFYAVYFSLITASNYFIESTSHSPSTLASSPDVIPPVSDPLTVITPSSETTQTSVVQDAGLLFIEKFKIFWCNGYTFIIYNVYIKFRSSIKQNLSEILPDNTHLSTN